MTKPLSPAAQQKAANKMAVNGVFFAFFLAFETLMASLMGEWTKWLGIIAGHTAILAAVMAFVWPLGLWVLEERDRRQRTV